MRVITVRKVIPGKRTCDLCRKSDQGEISEVQIGFVGGKTESVSHWVDACSACVEGLKSGALRFGPLGLPNLAKRVLRPEENRSGSYPTYGPRPRNGRFQCRDCRSAEYPLFGRGGKTRDYTYCSRCMTRRYPTAFSASNATPDARAALEESVAT